MQPSSGALATISFEAALDGPDRLTQVRWAP